ncbi:hypothetical protein F4780DRAFT_795793 [Xylariomycetidae sp. FL0641]|nr:hypothetical protein F4780DRAFT_795793 [Xylariomycetidae sp. FL0641]
MGFLVPPWYKSESPGPTSMDICSIIWGLSLCCSIYSGSKAVRQSWKAYKRARLLSGYIILVWAEWISGVVLSVLSWLFLIAYIEPSFWLFSAMVCLWATQIQCILQILMNRVSLIAPSKSHVRLLRIGSFLVVAAINISVFCIWIPARLQISHTYISINNMWDRLEKVIYTIVDALVNAYFVYAVRTRLKTGHLTKFTTVVRYSVLMICISVSLNVLIIGIMSLASHTAYIQFHPLVYLVKLHIELNLAELVSKLMKASNAAELPQPVQMPWVALADGDSSESATRNSKTLRKEDSSMSATRNSKTRRITPSDIDEEFGDLGAQVLGSSGLAKALEMHTARDEEDWQNAPAAGQAGLHGSD